MEGALVIGAGLWRGEVDWRECGGFECGVEGKKGVGLAISFGTVDYNGNRRMILIRTWEVVILALFWEWTMKISFWIVSLPR